MIIKYCMNTPCTWGMAYGVQWGGVNKEDIVTEHNAIRT